MPTETNRELAATVLVEALYTTDETACARYDISVRSLQRWRKQLAEGDPVLAGFVATKKEALDAAWAENLPGALAKGLKALDECFTAIQSDAEAKKKPDVIHAIAGAIRICAEMHYTGKVIDARLAGIGGETGGLFGKSTAQSLSGRPN